MRKVIVLLLIIALAGCSSAHKTKAVRGQSAVRVECSGMFSNWDRCYTRAEHVCAPRTYKVIAKSSDVKEDPDDFVFGWNPAGSFSRRMLIVCH